VKPCDDTLGMMGPVIRAVVGDTIKVVFRNNTRFPASVHPHGVFYAKNAEGAPYADGTSGQDKADDAVQPGDTYTYSWKVPERAGPGPMDGSSVMWMYHSHTDEIADTNAGLVGPMVITAKGKGDPDTATPAGRGPGDLLLLHRGERERQPLPRRQPSEPRPGAAPGGVR
jgi:FtsP/CotA-like multicopper oxidase with cupredoxin domain